MRKIVSIVFVALCAFIIISCQNTTSTKYEVKFYADNVLLKTELVVEGEKAIAPEDPTKEGYSFKNWDKDFDEVKENLEVHAVFEINSYTVRFLNGATVLKSETVTHGANATAPTVLDTPSQTFKGWDKSFDNVKSNLDVNALFDEVTFEVSFFDGETLIQKVTVLYGATANQPEAPHKEGYTFVGWDKPFTNVTSDLEVYAQYQINVYTVRFLDGETELKVEQVEHGKDATYPSVPTKEGYTFKSWDKEVSQITSDLTVNALYEVNKYEVKFFHEETLLSTVIVEHGKDATPPQTPDVEGYHFVKWDKDFTNIKSDLVVFAVYEENEPIISMINLFDNKDNWSGFSSISDNLLVKPGVFGLQFRLKSMNDGVEYMTSVDGTKLEGDTLVFYLKANEKVQIFIRFYYADQSNIQYMINGTIEGGIVEIPLSSFQGLNLDLVTSFGFFMQEWTVAYEWMFVEFDNVALVDQKGLAKYLLDHSYEPYIEYLGSTEDSSLWISTGGQDARVEVIEDGLNLIYRTDFNGSDFRVSVDTDELLGDTLLFFMKGLAGAEVFVRFYRENGTFEHILINPKQNGSIVELSLSSFNIDMSEVTQFGFFVQYWGANLYTESQIIVKDIAVVDHKGRLAYLAEHQLPAQDFIISPNNNAGDWATSNASNEAFAVVENAADGLLFKFVSSFEGSTYKLAINDQSITGNTLTFNIKGNPLTEVFVRFFYADGSYVHVLVNPDTDGKDIELSMSTFTDLNLSSVTHFGFYIQDWQTAFGWAEVVIKDLKVVTK